MFAVRSCTGCGSPGAWLCPRCRAALRPAPSGPPPPGLDAAAALLTYEGPARAAVLAVKYQNRRDGVPEWGVALGALLPTLGVDGAAAWTVTWAPTTAARRRARGFDQAALLARATARAAHLPCRGLLRRAAGAPQTGRGRPERIDGPTFTARRPASGGVVVIDDVVTTGSTLAAAGRALRAAGARSVVGLALAATPSGAPRIEAAAVGEISQILTQGGGPSDRHYELIDGGVSSPGMDDATN